MASFLTIREHGPCDARCPTCGTQCSIVWDTAATRKSHWHPDNYMGHAWGG